MQLYIGNKNYSSWSMRPWVLMREKGLIFDEVPVRFDSFAPGSVFKTTVSAVSPTGKVPALVDGALVVWDTLAITEYLAERHPEARIWPADAATRARARSMSAEMHSSFGALRSHCPMNIEADLRETGALIWRDQAGVRADVQRLCSMWEAALATSGGPMLCGDFSAVDAMYAPVCTRLVTYDLPVSPEVRAYVERALQRPGVRAWTDGARAEHDFLDFEEPYRLRPGA